MTPLILSSQATLQVVAYYNTQSDSRLLIGVDRKRGAASRNGANDPLPASLWRTAPCLREDAGYRNMDGAVLGAGENA